MVRNKERLFNLTKLKHGLFIFTICLNLSSFIAFNNQSSLMLSGVSWIVQLFPFIIATLSLFDGEINLKDIIVFILLLILGYAIYYNSKDSNVFRLALYIFSFRRANPIRILKDFFWISLISLISTVVFSFFGIAANLTSIDNGTVKYSLGFTQPNLLGRTVFSLLLITITLILIFELNLKGIKKFLFYFFMLILFVILYVSSSTTPIITIAVGLVLYFFIRKWKKTGNIFLKKFIVILGLFIMLSSFLFSFYSVFANLNQSKFWIEMNTMFTGRLQFNQEYFHNYGISTFGQFIITNTDKQSVWFDGYHFLDNAYLLSLIKFGIIFTIIQILYYFLLYAFVIRRGKIELIIPIVTLVLYGVAEQGTIYYYFNFILLFSSVFYLKKNYTKNRGNK